MSYLLWTLQALLALLFLAAGGIKLTAPIDTLTSMIPLPALLIRTVGAAECLGALGLILPGLLKIRPRLTVLAAQELVHLMIAATLFTLVTADAVSALLPIVVGCLAAFVAYGRARLAPHTSSARSARMLQTAA